MMSRKAFYAATGMLITGLMLVACTQEQAGNTAATAPVVDVTATNISSAPATTRAPDMTGPHTGVVRGMVTDNSGRPVAGAFVKLDIPERHLTFMVISQEGGHYSADRLPSGSYTVQGVGGDYQSEWSAPITVTNGATVMSDLSLNVQRGPDLAAAWPRRVPEHLATLDSLPAGTGRDIIAAKCSGCHAASQVVASRYDAGTWENTIEDMSDLIKESNLPELTEADAKVLHEYLVANLAPMTPPDPNSRFPHELMQGEARNYRSVQYNLTTPDVETHDVAVDPQGIGWANQRTGGNISRFDPVTYEYTEIAPPLLGDAKRARPGNLQISPEGIMWLADPFSKRWLSYDIANDKWTSWLFPMDPKEDQIPGANPVVHHNGKITDTIRGQVQGNSLVINPHDDMIYMSGPGSIRRLDPATGEWTTWDSPTWLATQKNPGGYGITVDGGNNIWEAENLVDKLARYTPATGEVRVFDLEKGAYPRRMDYDNNGNVFVGLWGASKILKIDYKTTEMSEILPPIRYNGAYSIDFDKSSNLLWVTLQTADYIARYNLDSREWLMLPLPQAESDVRRIEVDQNNPKRVWWVTNAFDARIGYIELLGN
jgi:streptogramin lyase